MKRLKEKGDDSSGEEKIKKEAVNCYSIYCASESAPLTLSDRLAEQITNLSPLILRNYLTWQEIKAQMYG